MFPCRSVIVAEGDARSARPEAVSVGQDQHARGVPPQMRGHSVEAGPPGDADWILSDDGDLGYPATVELADGSLFTVYYQQAAGGEKCSILYSRWRLPENLHASHTQRTGE